MRFCSTKLSKQRLLKFKHTHTHSSEIPQSRFSDSAESHIHACVYGAEEQAARTTKNGKNGAAIVPGVLDGELHRVDESNRPEGTTAASSTLVYRETPIALGVYTHTCTSRALRKETLQWSALFFFDRMQLLFFICKRAKISFVL